MKLFYFNPNGYGEEAFVVAENRKKAIKALKATKCKKDNKLIDGFLKDYHKKKIHNMVNCLGDYTIDEFPVGHVVFSEIA